MARRKQDGGRGKYHPRGWVQALATLAGNSYWPGFRQGGVYSGAFKQVCVPGLNCYSCPGAWGSCPVGALQAVLGNRNYSFSFYLLGLFLLFGAALGRFVCGWLCPFGWFEDLLYQIPGFRKRNRLPGERFWRGLRYLILLLFVILLPLFAVDLLGQGQPWFCSYLCPSGALMGGLPLFLLNRGIRGAAGWLYAYKMGLLIGIALLSLIVYRPFCRYLCPLGAVYGLFNPIALSRYRVDARRCIGCGACRKSCKLDLPLPQQPNTPACLHCDACRQVCPTGAITRGRRREAGRTTAEQV